MPSPKISLGMTGNVFSRMMHFQKAGDIEKGHTHNFDHLTLLAKGKILIRVNQEETEYVAPRMIWISASEVHELKALEDDTVAFCIHAVRDGDEIVDASMVPNGVDINKVAASMLCQ
jgi:quercetin dioxygenase-like cupin family protein